MLPQVVMETGILAHFLSPINQEMTEVNQRMKSNFYTKIPEYAREYKKEYLFIRGINKEFKYFIDKLDDLNNGLFVSHRADRIKYFMKRFLRGQEKGKLKDISNMVFREDDVHNLIFINKQFRMYKIRWDYFNDSDYSDDSDEDDVDVVDDDSDDEDVVDGKNVYPGFKEIYDIFELLFSKLNIKYEYDSDSDSDSDLEYFNIKVKNVVSDSDLDSDSDSDDSD